MKVRKFNATCEVLFMLFSVVFFVNIFTTPLVQLLLVVASLCIAYLHRRLKIAPPKTDMISIFNFFSAVCFALPIGMVVISFMSQLGFFRDSGAFISIEALLLFPFYFLFIVASPLAIVFGLTILKRMQK